MSTTSRVHRTMSTTSRMHRMTQHRSALAGVEARTLVSDRQFPRHTHDQFGVGIMLAGAHRSWSHVGQVEAQTGDTIMVNPGEMHDGAPLDGNPRAWRMLYLAPAVVSHAVAEEISASQYHIVRPAVHDPLLAARFSAVFGSVVAAAADHLLLEQELLRLLMLILRRHCLQRPSTANCSPAVAKVLRRLDADPAAPMRLATLADFNGVSRFQLIRGFAREVGTTPHAWLVQRRVRLARQLLAAGQPIVDAAVNAGFADQSHLTRAFVRQYGVTPARYVAAIA